MNIIAIGDKQFIRGIELAILSKQGECFVFVKGLLAVPLSWEVVELVQE